jgi:signal transduction histidine kinase
VITRHDPLGEFSPAHREIMVQRTDRDLAHRSRTAAFSHFAIAGVVYFATPYPVDHPRIIAAMLATTFVPRVWRLVLNLGFSWLYALSHRVYRQVFFYSTLASAASWGAFTGLTVLLYGFHQATFLQLAIAVGVSAGAVVPFSPRMRLYGWFTGLMLGPTIVCTSLLGGAAGAGLTALLIFGLAFLLVQGKLLCGEYWRALRTSMLLELRAAELEEARNQAECANRRLQAKNAELDSFVYSVSHDLKAPLVAVDGFAGMLAEDYGDRLDDEGRQHLGRLQACAQQMAHLIQDLLALSRIGRESRPAEPVRLDELVAAFRSEAGPRLDSRGIEVVVRETGVLWGVRSQLEQVTRNLLGNAAKYMGDTPRPLVEVGVLERGALLECYVRDNGIGIDPRYHDKVFEIFQRLQDVEVEGTGVGLAIVKKIVEGVGGRIWVESDPGKGSTFRFTWPAGPGREPVSGGGPAGPDVPAIQR